MREQMALPGSRTNPDLIADRFLLKPGRRNEQAVKVFEPYESITEENPEARSGWQGADCESEGGRAKAADVCFREQPTGGNAISTIEAMLRLA